LGNGEGVYRRGKEILREAITMKLQGSEARKVLRGGRGVENDGKLDRKVQTGIHHRSKIASNQGVSQELGIK